MRNTQVFRKVWAGLELFLRVMPNAGRNQILGVEQRDDAGLVLQVRVCAVPDKGKANKAVIELVAKQFKLRKSDIEIIRGQQARHKTLLVKTKDVQAVVDQLQALVKPFGQ